jgi:hypothetical protein
MRRTFIAAVRLLAAGCLGATLAPLAAHAAEGTGATVVPNAFNPGISLILEGVARRFTDNPDNYTIPGFVLSDEAGPGTKGLSLDESEISMTADVDDRFYGQFTTSIQPDGALDIEEGFIETRGLPAGLTARFGRIKSDVGYLNDQHSHVWDFYDAPLVYRAMFGDQYQDDGVQLTWLAPTVVYVEVGGELYRGDAFPAFGAAGGGAGTWTAFVHAGSDVGVSSSWRAGLSRLVAKADAREDPDGLFTGRTDVNIADFVWKWAPFGNPVHRNFKFQSEYLWGDQTGSYDTLGALDAGRRGWYAQAVYQFIERWRAGVRYGAVTADNPGVAFAGTALDPTGATPRRYSTMVDWSNSEFSRIRLQYNHDESGPGADDQVFVQYLMALGTHGAHAF